MRRRLCWGGVLAVLLTSCTQTQTVVENARTAVKKHGEDIQRLKDTIVAGCAEPPPAPPFCAELVARFNELQSGYTLVNDAMGEVP